MSTAKNYLEALVGPLDGKKRYRLFKARAEQLPRPTAPRSTRCSGT